MSSNPHETGAVSAGLIIVGRSLVALLFLAGAAQKCVSPGDGQALLSMFGLPTWLIWPAMVFNLVMGVALLFDLHIRTVALALAGYCMLTSAFHFQPDDGWQMSILIKNWAISGGLLMLAGSCRGRGQR